MPCVASRMGKMGETERAVATGLCTQPLRLPKKPVPVPKVGFPAPKFQRNRYARPLFTTIYRISYSRALHQIVPLVIGYELEWVLFSSDEDG